MEIILENLHRNFGRQKVITGLNFRFEPGISYAILGGNGSGKSTLLRLIQGSLSPTSGKVVYIIDGKPVKREDAAFHMNLAGPYLELIEELTAREFLNFFNKFRKFNDGVSAEVILEKTMLQEASNKMIRNFSSGMKQRLRLGLAMFTKASVVMLDEPTSNLDPEGVHWFRDLVSDHLANRTLIIGSNFDQNEIDFCGQQLHIAGYSTSKD